MSASMSSGSALIVAVAAMATVASIAAYGCATGANTQPDIPVSDTGPTPDGTTGDVGGDGARPDTTGIDGNHETRPLFDSDLFCGDLGVPNTCDKVIDVGSVPLAGTRKVFGNVPLGTGALWYKVTFESLGDPTAHPKISLDAAEAGLEFRFEVVKSCAKEAFVCGDDAKSDKLTSFEQKYDDADPPSDADDAFIPIEFGAGGVAYVRVYRDGPASACTGFVLNISN